jgi:hypothetical protein
MDSPILHNQENIDENILIDASNRKRPAKVSAFPNVPHKPKSADERITDDLYDDEDDADFDDSDHDDAKRIRLDDDDDDIDEKRRKKMEKKAMMSKEEAERKRVLANSQERDRMNRLNSALSALRRKGFF